MVCMMALPKVLNMQIQKICLHKFGHFYQPTAIQTVVEIMTEKPYIKWLWYVLQQQIDNCKCVSSNSSTVIRANQKASFPIQQEVTDFE